MRENERRHRDEEEEETDEGRKIQPGEVAFSFLFFLFFFKMRECVPAKFKVLKCNWSCILTESVRHLWRGH